MAQAWLGLGANLGDPAAQIASAIAQLDAHPDITVTARSALIVTKPWGKTDQPDFLNGAIAIETSLTPAALLDAALATEKALGRERREVWGPRSIDIDIIAYERLVLRTGRLTLPHPHAHARNFVLKPLRQIAPDVADWLVDQASAVRRPPQG